MCLKFHSGRECVYTVHLSKNFLILQGVEFIMSLIMPLTGAIILALAVSLQVQAAEWSAEPNISLRSGYNDNIRMTLADHDSVWETALTPSVRFGVAKEHQGLFGNADVVVRRFTGGEGRESGDVLDREDAHLSVNAYHNMERDRFAADLNITRDSTLDTELDETGNVIEDRATRLRKSISPSWTRSLTEKTRMELSYQFSAVSYSDEIGPLNLIDYDYDVFSAALLRQMTPRIQGTLSASYSRYQPETNLESKTLSLQAGISRNFSETLSASFLAGRRETTSDTLVQTGFCIGAPAGATFPDCGGATFIPTGLATDEIENTGAVYSASITKVMETGKLSASLSRSSSPSGDGELLDTTRLSLAGEHRFTQKLTSSLRIEFSDQETIVSRTGITELGSRQFFRVTPRLAWRWRQEWELAGEYQYAENEEVSGSDTATSNAVYVTLSYRPTKIYISR